MSSNQHHNEDDDEMIPTSPISSLSSIPSDELVEAEADMDDEGDATLSGGSDGETRAGQPPSKRRRISTHTRRRNGRGGPNAGLDGSGAPNPPLARVGPGALLYEESAGVLVNNETDVSSDTTGSVPPSPSMQASSLGNGANAVASGGSGASSGRVAGFGAGDSSISNDIDGRGRAGSPDEETLGADQIRACHWDSCTKGNLGDQDTLVRHINDDHIGRTKKSRYTCEWSDCKAKGKTQMSAYALKAHMRSHTKEKPFYCSLPECDRSFTRSDALSKHMRTVHETESLKTTEQYPKIAPSSTNLANSQRNATTIGGSGGTPEPISADGIATSASGPPKKLKLVFGSSSKSPAASNGIEPNESNGMANANGDGDSSAREDLVGVFESSLDFTDAETSMPRRELFRLLRRQIHWAEQESVALQDEVKQLEKVRKREWLRKELLLENVMEADFARAESKGVFGAVVDGPLGARDAMFGSLDANFEEDDGDDDDDGDAELRDGEEKERKGPAKREVLLGRADALRVLDAVEADTLIARKLPMVGASHPWYRDDTRRKPRAPLAPENQRRGKSSRPANEARYEPIMLSSDSAEDEMDEIIALGSASRSRKTREREIDEDMPIHSGAPIRLSSPSSSSAQKRSSHKKDQPQVINLDGAADTDDTGPHPRSEQAKGMDDVMQVDNISAGATVSKAAESRPKSGTDLEGSQDQSGSSVSGNSHGGKPDTITENATKVG